MKIRHRLPVVLVLTLLTFGTGCDEPSVTPPPPPPHLPFAGSPDQLAANVKTVHEDMNFMDYSELIDEGFRFYLNQATIDEFGLPRDHFTFAEDLAITASIFSGNPPADGIGGIDRISFDTFVRIADWQPTEDPEFPGAVEADYAVGFTIEQGTTDGSRFLSIDGTIRFYLSMEDVEYQGRIRTRYRLLGQIDGTTSGVLKNTVPTADVSWGSIKALFLPGPEERSP